MQKLNGKAKKWDWTPVDDIGRLDGSHNVKANVIGAQGQSITMYGKGGNYKDAVKDLFQLCDDCRCQPISTLF